MKDYQVFIGSLLICIAIILASVITSRSIYHATGNLSTSMAPISNTLNDMYSSIDTALDKFSIPFG